MMRRALAVPAVLLTTLLLASLAGAESPGKNGRLAFMRKDASGHWQVWVSGPRLDRTKQLTLRPHDSGWPVWSPDGRKLAFDSNRSDPNPGDTTQINDIFTMNPDGSGVTRLTNGKGVSTDAGWSPNGSLIAFASDRGDFPDRQGIYVMKPDGGGVRRITKLPVGYESDSAPRFSPDGKRIVFTRYRGKNRAEKAALFTVRLDGTGLLRLTTFAVHAGDADWAPDGKHIVFEAYPSPDSFGDVYVVDANGQRLRNLTRNPLRQAGSSDPVWAPDGTKILFLDNRRVNGIGQTGLATMRPDGSARAFLSRISVESHQPDWESIG